MLGTPNNRWFQASQLEVLITRACDPSLPEPNYAAHLEVADYINTKKANTPREASMLIARLANHRNPHIAMLALSLLDTLVKSCGYPFHLQIATKEFLNELVRRFPERPPPFPGPVMSRVLDLIHGWKEGICSQSRWREDLGNIRDMHRLLTFKGYRFRDLPRQPPIETAAEIKSAEELESEDREAQSAKLQELIRRGTPRDLAAAQDLMKALAGANPDAKPDYNAQALAELEKLEQKVILLNEMLDNADVARGEKFAAGDAYDQVAIILKNARPKLQKWISDAETDDTRSLDTFLQMNDQINTVLDRFEAFKKGDYSASSNPIPTELSNGKNEQSLIDLEDGFQSQGSASAGRSEPVDDIMNLFSSPSMSAPTAAPSQQQQYNQRFPPVFSSPMPGMSSTPILGMTNSNSYRPASGSPRSLTGISRQQSPQPQQFGSIMLPGTPQPISHMTSSTSQGMGRVASPNYFNSGRNALPQTMIMPSNPQRQQNTIPTQNQNQSPVMQPGPKPSTATSNGSSQGKDPFADLVGLF